MTRYVSYRERWPGDSRAIPSSEWRPVPGFELRYSVSSVGAIINNSTGQILFGEIDRDGYRRVNLSKDGKTLKRRVHRLVCEAFHGPCPEGMECAHLDGQRRNNCASNLSWATSSDNNRQKVAHGTAQSGVNHPRAKLTIADVSAIRASAKSTRKLSAEYGVSQSHIVRIRNGDRWQEQEQSNERRQPSHRSRDASPPVGHIPIAGEQS